MIRTIALIFIALLLVACSGCDFPSADPKAANEPKTQSGCAIENETIRTQQAALKAQFEMQAEQVKHVNGLQLAVMKACIDKGGTPQLVGANVGCAWLHK
jgi:hypothetical protein